METNWTQPKLFEHVEPLPHEEKLTAESMLAHDLQQMVADEEITESEALQALADFRRAHSYPDDIYIERKYD